MPEVALDDGFDDPAIQRSDVNAKHGPGNEENAQLSEIEHFHAPPIGNNDLGQLPQSHPEHPIHVALALSASRDFLWRKTNGVPGKPGFYQKQDDCQNRGGNNLRSPEIN